MATGVLKSALENIPESKCVEAQKVLTSNDYVLVQLHNLHTMHLQWLKDGLEKRFKTKDEIDQWYTSLCASYLNEKRSEAFREFIKN